MFILSAQRDGASFDWWDKYQAYLAEHEDAFPNSAFELATSDWFHGNGQEAPHDAWLQSVRIQERDEENRSQFADASIEIQLLGAYHDGQITLRYGGVTGYSLANLDARRSLGDWRYCEFRLADSGNFIHEIEWWSPDGQNTWLIEAETIAHTWTAFA